MPLLLLSVQLTNVWGPHVIFSLNLLPPLHQEGEVLFADGDGTEAELLEAGEHGGGGREGAREGPEAEVEAREGGRAREEGAGELQMRLDRGRVGWFTRTSWTRPWCAAMGVAMGEGAGHGGGDAGGGGVGGEQWASTRTSGGGARGVLGGEAATAAGPREGTVSLVGCSHGGGGPGVMRPRRRRRWWYAAMAVGPREGTAGEGPSRRGQGGGGEQHVLEKRNKVEGEADVWAPHVSELKGEKQQGHFGLYENTQVCEWVQRHQRRIK